MTIIIQALTREEANGGANTLSEPEGDARAVVHLYGNKGALLSFFPTYTRTLSIETLDGEVNRPTHFGRRREYSKNNVAQTLILKQYHIY